MKKIAKIGAIAIVAIMSGTVYAAQVVKQNTGYTVEELCSDFPLVCSVGVESNGTGDEPTYPKPKDPNKSER